MIPFRIFTLTIEVDMFYKILYNPLVVYMIYKLFFDNPDPWLKGMVDMTDQLMH